MPEIQTILTIATAVVGFIATVAVPTAIKVYVNLKKAKAVITEKEADKQSAIAAEEKAEKILQMISKANDVVAELEKKFAPQDAAVKSVSPTATLGTVKKECALAELSELARTLGLAFDRPTWGEKIDEIVKLTRCVNARPTDTSKVA